MNEHVALKVPDFGYDADFYAWSLDQAELLRAGRIDAIDFENVAEEIASLARSDRRAVKSQMIRLVEYLLKSMVARDRLPENGWRASIVNARSEIDLVVDDSPSLRREQPVIYREAWRRGAAQAVDALQSHHDGGAAALAALVASGEPVIAVDDALDPAWFPDGPNG